MTAIFAGYPGWGVVFAIPAAFCLFMALRPQQKEEEHFSAPVVTFAHNLEQLTDRLAYVENVADTAARDVLLLPITVGIATYSFKRIPLLRQHSREPLELRSAMAGGLDLFRLWDPMKLDHDHWLGMAAKDFPGDFTVPLTIEWVDPKRKLCREYQKLHVTADLNAEVSAARLDQPATPPPSPSRYRA